MRCAAIAVMAAALSVSCSKPSGTGDSLPQVLSISGEGIENGNTPRQMYSSARGVWDIYAKFDGGKSVSIFVDAGKPWLTFNVDPDKDGVCRLRVDAATGTWSLVRIDKVSLVVAEGDDKTSKYGEKTPIEAHYEGAGVWSVKDLFVATDHLRYRFELETSDPEELKYWCAEWDNAGSAPSSHDAKYLTIRSLGEDEYSALYLKENRACWMFPGDKTLKLACFTLSMNSSAPGQEIAYYSPHTGPKAVFIGDSITYLWKQSAFSVEKSKLVIPYDPMPSYMTPNGSDKVWIRFHPEFFSVNDYANVGISGQNTTQMLERFEADVLEQDPSCVVIMGGTNDLAQGYAEEQILSNIVEMAERAAALGMNVILCSVTPCNRSYASLSNPSTKGAHIITLNNMIKTYAESKGFTYCDYWSAIVAKDGLAMDGSYWLYDDLHPCPDCYVNKMQPIVKALIDSVLSR